MTEGSGLQHRGKYALLKLRYSDWGVSVRVTVHIVDQLPDDVVEFYNETLTLSQMWFSGERAMRPWNLRAIEHGQASNGPASAGPF